MEGVRCQEPGCSVHDFLPFHCPKCSKDYCLDHRSRFSHKCLEIEEIKPKPSITPIQPTSASLETPQAQPPQTSTFMGIVNAVFSGFGALPTTPTPQASTHYPIAKNQDFQTSKSEGLDKTMEKLTDISNTTTIQSERNISEQTKRILIKTKAKGNENLIVENRFYLIVHLEDILTLESSNETNIIRYCYFSSSATLGEVLHNMLSKSNLYFDGHFKTYPDHILSFVTADTPDWKYWDRNLSLKRSLKIFEEVKLIWVPIAEVIENQKKFVELKLLKNENSITHKTLQKGHYAWYHKHNQLISSKEEALLLGIPIILVKIIGVHHDDFPNIYYTIKMEHLTEYDLPSDLDVSNLTFYTEKQTDSIRLIPDEMIRLKSHQEPLSISNQPADFSLEQIARQRQELQATLCQQGFVYNLRVSYNNKEYPSFQISSLCQIGQLKELIALVLENSIQPKNVKIIYKGIVFKNDHQLIKDTKIIDNSKLVVIGSPVMPV